jgi:archaellum component FlaG (FlaF/FlaG flagellin family)
MSYDSELLLSMITVLVRAAIVGVIAGAMYSLVVRIKS